MSPLMHLALYWLSRNSGWHDSRLIADRIGARHAGATLDSLWRRGYVDRVVHQVPRKHTRYRINAVGRAAR